MFAASRNYRYNRTHILRTYEVAVIDLHVINWSSLNCVTVHLKTATKIYRRILACNHLNTGSVSSLSELSTCVNVIVLLLHGAPGRLSHTGPLGSDFSGAVPENADTAKIVITPANDEDGKVSLAEVFGYADGLTVTVKR